MLEDACDSCDAVLGLLKQLRCDIELPRSMAGFLTAQDVGPITSDDLRRFPRRAVRTVAALEHGKTFSVIPREAEWHKIYTKNISHGGLAFLHSCQLYPGERMRVLLPDENVRRILPERQKCLVEVARCRRLADHCYEIGAFFVDKSVDARE